ncbi:WD40 repeat domain-containing protein [Virgisporangium aurantiacum]|uniref:WD40 repeat domain-containing protein n=1 Tax=Virgisporangium aurantiacum TaxID=175570 RepID=A0A8J3ZL88_9ACTN|nr:LpqB family beta-propeller domain-containing protein [Virgisporangium aurantiacum]GIJ63546.1 hypothetical protein Vau01_110620 [Virgisporangium aurantiacum]
MRSSCDGCGTAYLRDVHFCIVCGASPGRVGNTVVPITSQPPAPSTTTQQRQTTGAARRTTTSTRTWIDLPAVLRWRTVARLLSVGFMVCLVGAVGTGVVAGLWWIIAGDEPAAAEYIELNDRTVHALRFSPDGTTLFVDTDDPDAPRSTWDLGARPWKDLDTAPAKDKAIAVAVSSDGRRSAIGMKETKRARKFLGFTWDNRYTDGVVRVRDSATGDIVWETKVRELDLFDDERYGEAEELAFSPDGSLLAGGYNGGPTVMWDAITGGVLTQLAGSRGRFSPDGKLFALLGGGIKLWDTAKRQLRTTLQVPPDPKGDASGSNGLVALEFSPDGRWLATSQVGGTVRVWNVATGTVVAGMNIDYGYIRHLAFSPDGRLIAARQDLSETVWVWDTATGAQRAALPGHYDLGGALMFSPDGLLLAEGADDGTVWLWDTANWQKKRVLEHRERTVFWTKDMTVATMAFSPDGKRFAVASNEKDDGRVALWELS